MHDRQGSRGPDRDEAIEPPGILHEGSYRVRDDTWDDYRAKLR